MFSPEVFLPIRLLRYQHTYLLIHSCQFHYTSRKCPTRCSFPSSHSFPCCIPPSFHEESRLACWRPGDHVVPFMAPILALVINTPTKPLPSYLALQQQQGNMQDRIIIGTPSTTRLMQHVPYHKSDTICCHF